MELGPPHIIFLSHDEILIFLIHLILIIRLKVWSLAPPLYSLLIHIASPSPRSLILLILASSWGVRLTYNFWRRGGYAWPPWRGEEDYRLLAKWQ